MELMVAWIPGTVWLSNSGMARVHGDDGGQTLVAFCDVAGLDDVYERLSAAVGRSLPVPPTHVTLYTSQPGMKGIGLSTADAAAMHATALAAADAALLRATSVSIGTGLAQCPGQKS